MQQSTKFEILNPKQAQMYKIKNNKYVVLEHSNFEFVLCFEFRVSNFSKV